MLTPERIGAAVGLVLLPLGLGRLGICGLLSVKEFAMCIGLVLLLFVYAEGRLGVHAGIIGAILAVVAGVEYGWGGMILGIAAPLVVAGAGSEARR